MLSESLIEAFRARLDELGLDLADLRIGGTPNRPLVQVRIEWPPGELARRVTVDDCATASRALERWLDQDGTLGPRYVLEVSSPGLDRPLRWPRHWARFVGRRTVVETVEDPGSQVALEEARFEDPDFQVGDVLEEEVPFEAFGRTAVQAAKQRIIQRVREGERARIREEFTDKVGELLSGEVQQIERGKIVVMLAKFREAEAIIPYREQNHREHFHQGDTIRAVLKRIEETPKGPRLILSRADRLFVKALFKLEVPEIQQSIVEIRATAREAGSRTKIAVSSRDDSIDPVGACVGLKGSRVQAVVNELNGERIDIVPWSPDPERFAKLSLAPARVARVFSDPE